MREFWENLSARERLLVQVGGSVAALFILMQFIVAPIFSWRAEQRERIDGAEGLYRLVAQSAPVAGAAGEGGAIDGAAARNAVSQSARTAGVELVFVNARPDGGIDANVAGADPEALFAWIGGLGADHGLIVRSADIARDSGNPDVVRAQLTFVGRG